MQTSDFELQTLDFGLQNSLLKDSNHERIAVLLVLDKIRALDYAAQLKCASVLVRFKSGRQFFIYPGM